MDKAFCGVAADAAGAGQQGLGVGGKLLHRHTGHPDIRGTAILMLAVNRPPTALLCAAVR